ncbi:MAG: TonB-dependent receptor [Bacteroidota bacterium]|nr:TonB-dependent receptor [Bacteroidota bacterium]
MKNLILFIALLSFFYSSSAQELKGRVTDIDNLPLPGAVIKIDDSFYGKSTGIKGSFYIKNLSEGRHKVTVSFLGFVSEQQTVNIQEGEVAKLVFRLHEATVMTDEITIFGTRAGKSAPLAFTEVNKEEIEKNNLGKDIPYILEMTPALITNSDAGNGVGYTTMRIRGSDISRINVTLDGVPLNDSESQGVWWVDLPDYASSVENIQVQRGAGTSTNGAGAFGANINFSTSKPNYDPVGEINTSYGSFNTYKTNIKVGTGLINNHFGLNARVSKIHSDGFIDRATTDMESVHLSGIYTDKKNLVKINLLHGIEETYQAWYGVTKDRLDTGRTHNPYSYDNETDNYKQTHAQLFFTHSFSNFLILKTALHYTKGAGYYEQYKNDESFDDYQLENPVIGDSTLSETDLIRRKWLDNDFYGIVYSLKYIAGNFDIIYGGSANQYEGGHFGRVIWMQHTAGTDIRHQWYTNDGIKTDFNNYIKVNYKITHELTLWGDMQYRMINYSIDGIDDDLRDISQTNDYGFLNPKAGLSYSSGLNKLYASLSTAQREPTRTDFADAPSDIKPTPETLYDYEMGYNITGDFYTVDANLYYMDYKNQLVLTGQINDVGSPISVNVPESYRTGIELSGAVKLMNIIKWEANAAFSKNKIKNFTAYVDDWDNWGDQETESYDETDISFSPELVAKSKISANLFSNFSVALTTQYVSRQYIDNTGNQDRSIDPYLVNNINLNYHFSFKKIKRINLYFSLNNFTNEKYETNAWVYRYISGGSKSAEYGYFPQAGMHFMSGLSIKF